MTRANPAPLGLVGFGLTTWMLSMINAGWFPLSHDIGGVLALAFAFGGLAQLVAGVMEYGNGNTFGTTAFFSYGAFWISFALLVQFFLKGVDGAYIGWYLLMWGVFTFYMWIGSLKAATSVMLVFLALWITYVLLAVGWFMAQGGGVGFTMIGGYLGLVTAILAMYASASQVINASHGKTVLWTGAAKGA